MDAIPLTLREANEYVEKNHRHHRKVVGHRFSVGVLDAGKLRGCAIVGRPVARRTNQYRVAEVTRLCTDGGQNYCSFLYGVCRRVAREMGFDSIQTFTLASEPGTSLKASGWKAVGLSPGKTWSVPSRGRKDKHPTVPKTKWECRLKPKEAGE